MVNPCVGPLKSEPRVGRRAAKRILPVAFPQIAAKLLGVVYVENIPAAIVGPAVCERPVHRVSAWKIIKYLVGITYQYVAGLSQPQKLHCFAIRPRLNQIILALLRAENRCYGAGGYPDRHGKGKEHVYRKRRTDKKGEDRPVARLLAANAATGHSAR